QMSTPNAAALRAVWGSGPDDVWAVGDIILHTAPAPVPRPPQAAPQPQPQPQRAPETAVWASLEVPSTAPLTALWGTTGNLYIVGMRGQLLHSIDDGATFAATKPAGEVDLYAVWGAGRRDVWVAGAGGKILRSTDEGQTWTEVPLGTNQAVYGIWGADANDVYLVGERGLILHTPDGGRSWRADPSGVTTDLRAVWGSSRGDVYVVGDGGTILHSTTGGSSFVRGRVPATGSLRSIWGSGAGHIFAAGDGLFDTTDGGKSWHELTVTGVAGFRAERVRGTSANDVFLVGSGDGAGLVLRTADGGKHFSGTGLPSTRRVAHVWSTGASTCPIAGGSLRIQGQKPAPGLAWTRQPIAGAAALNRMWGAGPGDVYVVGDKGFIARSTDRGRNWQKQQSGTTEKLNGV